MNNLSSYFGLVDAKIRASDKDLSVQGLQSLMAKRTNPALESENNDSKATEQDSEKETYTKDKTTGAWISKDQIEAKEKLASINKKWTKSSLQEEVKLLRVLS